MKNSLAVSRQCGLDAAIDGFVMFADCDDELSDSLALMHVVETLNEYPDYDMYHFTEIVRYKPDLLRGHYDPIPADSYQGRNLVFSHGKVYRLSFIREHDIKFKSELKTHEDVNFNIVMNALGAKEFESQW